MDNYIVAIDQGTTSTRSIVFDTNLKTIASAQQEFTQHFPQSGWVEHDPKDLLKTTLDTFQSALDKSGITAGQVAGIGITNQRETVVIWDKHTGQPVYNAIVWQDRRTAEFCQQLKAQGLQETIQQTTGLLADPYFSGTKINWILDNVDGVRERAEDGDLLAGTIDSWLIWNLTGRKVHATDATNASRSLLYDIHKGEWSDTLLSALNIPLSLLPEVKDCAADFGTTAPEIFGSAIPICGVAGDQHAAVVGQACFKPGMMKSTYGTGCFAMLNTGDNAVTSHNNLLTTIAYQLNGKTTYALEGSIFIAGAAVQWLRDGMKLIESAKDTQALAEAADPHQDVYLVPAFVGLGAPYWDPDARGALFGMTRNTGPAELAKATLESVGYQTRDLLEAMKADSAELKGSDTVLRVDGGMTASDWTMQFLADILNSPVDRPQILETTALGAAYLAGLQLGLLPEPEVFAENWALDKQFQPDMADDLRDTKYKGWLDAVSRTRTNN
uniref:Glycerol kinase n=1 Tax=uncultured Thiotrichaceae bacterium TaxID=298394 RepID=A0A6S6U8M1_9GAMM|nr:MAG: Glycerol kinase (EC [uncultured Thiotrichaceae bacterium]